MELGIPKSELPTLTVRGHEGMVLGSWFLLPSPLCVLFGTVNLVMP